MKKENRRYFMNHFGFKVSASVAVAALLFSIPALGRGRGLPFVVKLNGTAATGQCMPAQSGDAGARLKQNGVTAYKADNTRKNISFLQLNKTPLSSSDERVQSIASVLQTIDSIGDGSFSLHRDATFVFGSTPQASRQTDDHIQINPGGQNQQGMGPHAGHNHGGTTNKALIAHELGHYVANKGGLYAKYISAVGSARCNISGYAMTGSRNEEFAEVFAAYITNPDMLKEMNPSCQKGLAFLKDLFKETKTSSCLARKGLSSGASRGLASAGSGFGDLLSSLLDGAKKTKRECANGRGSTFCDAEENGKQSERSRSRRNYGEAVQ